MHFPARLQQLLTNLNVTDVFVNSPTEVYVLQSGCYRQVQNPFENDEQLVSFARAVIELGGDHLDFSNPIGDVVIRSDQWPALAELQISSVRIHAALALGIARQNLLSIRVHREARVELARFGDSRLLAKIAAQDSFIVSGSAGAGKTTLLRSMLEVRSELRTVVIEDSCELMPISGHFIGLQSRRANSEGAGEISLQRLLFEALRMRPQRLILGEARSTEVVTILEALNLGVDQVGFTVHANRASQAASRLLALWISSGRNASDFQSLTAEQNLTVVHVSNHKVEQIARLC